MCLGLLIDHNLEWVKHVPDLTPVSVWVFQMDMHFMKKIPPGAEACNVLVGQLDFLERPLIAFVRLAPAVLLTGLTEVPVPTRSLYILDSDVCLQNSSISTVANVQKT